MRLASQLKLPSCSYRAIGGIAATLSQTAAKTTLSVWVSFLVFTWFCGGIVLAFARRLLPLPLFQTYWTDFAGAVVLEWGLVRWALHTSILTLDQLTWADLRGGGVPRYQSRAFLHIAWFCVLITQPFVAQADTTSVRERSSEERRSQHSIVSTRPLGTSRLADQHQYLKLNWSWSPLEGEQWRDRGGKRSNEQTSGGEPFGNCSRRPSECCFWGGHLREPEGN